MPDYYDNGVFMGTSNPEGEDPSPTEDTPTPEGGLEQPSGNSQSVATKSVTDVSYLKTWATRTRSDITPIKEELEQGNYETAKSLIGDVLVNFDELDKYLGGLQ